MPKIKEWKNLKNFTPSQIELIESLEREYETEIDDLKRKLYETGENEKTIYNCKCKEKFCVYNDGSYECHYEGNLSKNDNGDCLMKTLL